jgi:hypothetical protein
MGLDLVEILPGELRPVRSRAPARVLVPVVVNSRLEIILSGFLHDFTILPVAPSARRIRHFARVNDDLELPITHRAG